MKTDTFRNWVITKSDTWFLLCFCKNKKTQHNTKYFWKYTREDQMKTLNMFYLVIYWTQKVQN